MEKKDLLTFKKGDYVKYNLKILNKSKQLKKYYEANEKEWILGDSKPGDDGFLINSLIGKPYQTELKFEILERFSETSLINCEIEILDFKSNEAVRIEAELLTLKSQMLIKDLNFKKKSEELEHAEEQLKLAIADVKKAKEAQVVEKLTVPKEEMDRIKQYALQDFVEDFITPYGTLKMAILAGEKSQNVELLNYLKGFTMVLGMIEKVLNDYGIIEFEAKKGEIFNPDDSKVLEQVIDDEKPLNTVVEVKQKGFKLFERVIKPSLVITTKYSDEKQQSLKKQNKKQNKSKNK